MHLNEYFCIIPIVFLSLFIISTYANLSNLVSWWALFFSHGNNSVAEILPNPITSPQAPLSLQQRISNVVKKAPHVLMRISSSYFQPAETPKNKLNTRTFSLKSNIEDEEGSHRRRFSGPLKAEIKGINSPKAEKPPAKVCTMCCENFCNAVIMDCGHGGICYNCSLELWKTVGVCHMCRSDISQVLQIESTPSQIVKVSSTTRAIYYDNE